MNRIAEVSCPPSEYLKWLNRIVDRCEAEGNDGSSETPISADQGSSELKEQLSDIRSWDLLNQELDALADDEGHIPDLRYLTQMVGSLKRAAAIQATLLAKEQKGKEPFHGYAKFYDEVVGKSCLEDFMSGDIKLFGERCDLDMASSRLISVGCGTGIAEAFILQHFGMKKENLLGVDLSEAMVNVASTRINARAVDFMAMDAREGEWDVVFSGSNVYQ
ncbi:MAG: class I SAM-dependent methyltransferase, partial [Proteobacteria bacterium]|nr:class I SAM-dependent methyltransferase [Pseudomonadota bacterium]